MQRDVRAVRLGGADAHRASFGWRGNGAIEEVIGGHPAILFARDFKPRRFQVQLPPFLLGPPQLLDRRRQVQEVNGDDRCPGAKVGIADKSIELAARLDQAGTDLVEALSAPWPICESRDAQVCTP
ncbi:MAG: hypothetical protein H0U16_12340 [Actinobacteria bacterium]|nr:hypothetical protein [Actinomycetota bacterium]